MSVVEAMLGTSPEGQDRRLNVLVVTALVTAIAVVIVVVAGVPKILSNASTTEALRRSAEIESCRSRYFSDTQQELADLQRDRAFLDVATSAGLTAIASKDNPAFLRAVTDSTRYRVDVLESADRVSAAAETYDRMVALSDVDPDEFLTFCRARGGGEG